MLLLEGAILLGLSWGVQAVKTGLVTAIAPRKLPPEFARVVVIPFVGPALALTDRRFSYGRGEKAMLGLAQAGQAVSLALLIGGGALLLAERRRIARERRWAVYPTPGGAGFAFRF